jgi:hypothetical protein
MDGIEIEITNQSALEYLVQNLEAIDKDKAIRLGLKMGGNVIKRGGMRRLRQSMSSPRGVTGNLLKSFFVRVKRNSLGVLIGFSQPEGAHAHLVDLGTENRFQIKGGRNTGAAKALHFWTDTRSEDMDAAKGMIVKGIENYVERVNNRL